MRTRLKAEPTGDYGYPGLIMKTFILQFRSVEEKIHYIEQQ